MSSHEERLAEANTAVLTIRKTMSKEFYPLYHIAPYASWMNAATGMVFFKGLYHVFYQHNPFSAEWGPMHWGHLTSEDMVHWRHHPIALAPGEDWDRDGCFSGSSVSHDDKLYLFYTGHHWLSDSSLAAANPKEEQIYEVQCLAVSEDGFNFEKKGIIVKPPAGFSHFRDPRVWFQDGRWWMICGARDGQDQGQIVLYSTDDLEDWDDSKFSFLARSDDRNIYMWECPDFFQLNGQHVLLASPQGNSQNQTCRNRYQSGTIIGSWKPDEMFEMFTTFRQIDRGHDFYVPQTFLTGDGRRVMMGWMEMWDSNMPTKKHKWSGLLTLPRELILQPNGRVFTRPIKELESIRNSYHYIVNREINENSQVRLVENCTACEVKLIWNMDSCTAEKYGLWLGKGLEISVDNQRKMLVVNRHYPEYTVSGYRSCELPERGSLSLHIFFDSSSCEVFINEGEFAMSCRIYPTKDDRFLALFAINGGASLVRCDLWGLSMSIMQ